MRFPLAAAPRYSSGPRFPTAPRFNPPFSGTLSRLEISQLNSLARREQLTASVPQGYDIVPPANRVSTRTGPLPGYQIVRLGRGHFNRLCLRGTVGGTRGLLMVDTGLNNTALNDETYRLLQFNAASRLPPGVPRALTINGNRTPLAQAPNFYVGSSDLGTLPVCLLPQRYLSDPGTPDEKGRVYDGLLGTNILRHYRAIIDCGRLVMYFDLEPNRRRADLAASFVRHGWTRVPMTDTGSHFTVPCVLNERQYRLVVDTASPFTNLDRSLLDKAKIGTRDLPLRGGLIGLNAEQIGLVDVGQIRLGNYTAAGVHLTATSQSFAAFGGRHDRSSEGPILGLLGGDILANHGAVIDIGNRALYLKTTAEKPARSQRTAGREQTAPVPG